MISKLKENFKESSKETIYFSDNSRQTFNQIYLQSNLPSNYVTVLSHACNVLKTYYAVLIEEFNTILDLTIDELNKGTALNDIQANPLFVADIGKVVVLQLKIILLMIKFHLFLFVILSDTLQSHLNKSFPNIYHNNYLEGSYEKGNTKNILCICNFIFNWNKLANKYESINDL